MPYKKTAPPTPRRLPTSSAPYDATTRLAPVRAYAAYDASLPDALRASPCLAALTPERTLVQTVDVLTRRPDLSWLASDSSAEQRRVALDIARDHFMCTTRCVELSNALQSLLRSGYLLRHPLDKDFHRNAELRRQELLVRLRDREPTQVRAISIGGCLLGPPGCGKSSSVRALLSAGPQVLVHRLTDFDGADFEQLVFVVVSCPSNGSMKSFCRRFLKQADAVLGTAYSVRANRQNKDDLIQDMANVADGNALGLLVVDHSENLVTNDGFAMEIIHDLTAIVDTLLIPVLFIGTPDTKPLWDASGSLGRRVSTYSPTWTPMPLDREWDAYVEHLLRLQVVREPIGFAREFADALWRHSQGVLDVANALFHKTQGFALKDGEKSLSCDLLDAVAQNEMPTIMAEIERHRRLRASEGKVEDGEIEAVA